MMILKYTIFSKLELALFPVIDLSIEILIWIIICFYALV